MIPRLVASQLEATTKSILLLGPRQTGKSTFFKSLKPDLTINLAKESEFLRYSTDVQSFEELIDDASYKTVFIDEIQRIPSLLNSIQATLDQAKTEGRRIRFFLSGSSARKLRRGSANLLPGRLFSYEMGGLCPKELHYKLDINKALQFGTLPEPYFEKTASLTRKLLTTYAATYLKEEIQAEALARDIQGFARFMNVMAEASGQIIDFSKISTRAKVSRTSSVRFVEILEDTLVAHRVNSFSEAGNADVIRHPKLYFFDVGVLNGLLGSFDVSPDRKGNLFEHLVYSQIRNSAMAHDVPVQISFFRTRHGTEVDFIVRHQGEIWAIEVKAGAIGSSDLHGIKKFGEYWGAAYHPIVVGMNERRRKKEGVLICDLNSLMKEMGF